MITRHQFLQGLAVATGSLPLVSHPDTSQTNRKADIPEATPLSAQML